ncbi:MAG TPA: TrkA family potassium uptake protein [Candidatus Ornithomonoglobus merdipullorum]|uniref:Trk system potassium uptake protein TrkA n=1 Tax=Candidatus Ornithomonoglobus merdipullorum TaxID=2840895 RepID=A0A9D1SEL8_9FIRM|nr:TrkA family potassium uptake protein [Candidatus Ornithomonoglobus merdipullorum]
MKIIIVGGGQVGGYIADLLIENGNNVVVIENKEKALEMLRKNGLGEEHILVGDGTDAKILESAGVRGCNALVCATGADETNLTAAMMAKFEYDVPQVVARVNNPKNEWLFNSGMGVDVRVNQADLIGHMIADEMNYHSIMTLMRLSKGEYSIVRVHVDYRSPNVDKSVAEIKLPAQALLIAVYEGDTLIIPHGETVIRAGQYILAFADESAMRELNRIFGAGD